MNEDVIKYVEQVTTAGNYVRESGEHIMFTSCLTQVMLLQVYL